jgi:hypothetical protein
MNRLARDVAINVVANLIAAAIIYLGGVAAGLLPYSGLLVSFAATLVIWSIAAAAYWAEEQARADKQQSVTVKSSSLLVRPCSCSAGIPIGKSIEQTSADAEPDPVFAYALATLFIVAIGGILHWRRAYIESQAVDQARDLDQRRRQALQNRPGRRRASREPRIIRRNGCRNVPMAHSSR